MITREQFIDEYLLNVESQGYQDWKVESLQKDLVIINEIWIEYLYQVCPQVAILFDPKIIDCMRKHTPVIVYQNN